MIGTVKTQDAGDLAEQAQGPGWALLVQKGVDSNSTDSATQPLALFDGTQALDEVSMQVAAEYLGVSALVVTLEGTVDGLALESVSGATQTGAGAKTGVDARGYQAVRGRVSTASGVSGSKVRVSIAATKTGA